MNNELKTSLHKSSEEELFFLFKFEGALDFEKRILAGQILHERGYDLSSLKHEKEQILQDIQSRIKEYDDIPKRKKANGKAGNRNSYFIMGFISYLLVTDIGMKLYNNEAVDILDMVFLSLFLLLFISYRLYFFPKRLEKLMTADKKDQELLKLRLKLIGTEWAF